MTSASRWIGAFDPCASSTSRTICARAVSLPTLVARKVNEPLLLRVPPITWLPGSFSTGMLSPVSIDSSTEEYPSSRMPSSRSVITQTSRRQSSGLCDPRSRFLIVFGCTSTSESHTEGSITWFRWRA